MWEKVSAVFVNGLFALKMYDIIIKLYNIFCLKTSDKRSLSMSYYIIVVVETIKGKNNIEPRINVNLPLFPVGGV